MQRLRGLLGPAPERRYRIGWDAVREQVGSPLPPDFVAFADEYGPGSAGVLSILVPGEGGYLADVMGYYTSNRRLRDEGDTGRFPGTAVFPEAGGLIPWAAAHSGGGLYFWRRTGADPGQWPVVVFDGQVLRELDEGTLDVIERFAGAGRTPVFRPYDLPALADGVWMTAPVDAPPGGDSRYPADYLALVAKYGPGIFGGALRLLVPDGPPGFELTAPGNEYGLRLWGRFESGVTCWWAPVWWSPDCWPVVLRGPDGGWQRLSLNTSGFLSRWLAGQLDATVLGPESRPRDRTFRPSRGDVITLPEPPSQPREPAPPFCAQLAVILGSPATTRAVGWDPVHEELGTTLPADYRWLIDRYGAGTVGDLSINGAPGGDDYDIVTANREARENFVSMQEEDDAYQGLIFFPDPGGLLLWSQNGDGSAFWWNTTKADPDDWTVVYGHHEEDEWTETPYGLAEFLVLHLTGRLAEALLPGTPNCPPRLHPTRDRRVREAPFGWSR